MIATGLWTVLKVFWNEATSNCNTPKFGNCNWEIDQIMVWFSLVLSTGPLNTNLHGVNKFQVVLDDTQAASTILSGIFPSISELLSIRYWFHHGAPSCNPDFLRVLYSQGQVCLLEWSMRLSGLSTLKKCKGWQYLRGLQILEASWTQRFTRNISYATLIWTWLTITLMLSKGFRNPRGMRVRVWRVGVRVGTFWPHINPYPWVRVRVYPHCYSWVSPVMIVGVCHITCYQQTKLFVLNNHYHHNHPCCITTIINHHHATLPTVMWQLTMDKK